MQGTTISTYLIYAQSNEMDIISSLLILILLVKILKLVVKKMILNKRERLCLE